MVYLIWVVHPKDYDIGKRPRIQYVLSNYFYFLNKDHELSYFSMFVPKH
jgi:hypothetical protein